MNAYDLYECELTDPRTMQQVIQLCADLQSDIRALRAQVAELAAMRDTLNAVFTIEAPAAECPYCEGFGHFESERCDACKGTGKVQS